MFKWFKTRYKKLFGTPKQKLPIIAITLTGVDTFIFWCITMIVCVSVLISMGGDVG